MIPWTSLKIESESDRIALVAILARAGYEVRIRREKVKNRYERYVEYRESEGQQCGGT